MKHKIVTVVLSVVLTLSMALPVCAEEVTDTETAQEVTGQMEDATEEQVHEELEEADVVTEDDIVATPVNETEEFDAENVVVEEEEDESVGGAYFSYSELEKAETISLDKQVIGTRDANSGQKWYKFTTDDTCSYYRYESTNVSMYALSEALYTENGVKVFYYDWLYSGQSFNPLLKLKRNATYYFCINGQYSYHYGDFNFKLTKLKDVADSMEEAEEIVSDSNYRDKTINLGDDVDYYC